MNSHSTNEQSEPASETGLAYLLGLDGNIEVQNEDGYSVKMQASLVAVTPDRPHGMKYSLTLHEPQGARLIGFDNAHSVQPEGSRFKHAGKKFHLTTSIVMPKMKAYCMNSTLPISL